MVQLERRRTVTVAVDGEAQPSPLPSSPFLAAACRVVFVHVRQSRWISAPIIFGSRRLPMTWADRIEQMAGHYAHRRGPPTDPCRVRLRHARQIARCESPWCVGCRSSDGKTDCDRRCAWTAPVRVYRGPHHGLRQWARLRRSAGGGVCRRYSGGTRFICGVDRRAAIRACEGATAWFFSPP